ncbi:unnamed protein product [Linum tenue]|uniref:Uncharacterized protein n=1 Tax=Linum tenue TaxID=586396 RepID=A0AAV0QY34_9ROSI|nr:unnamed protein product [Linum tenue]
MREELPIAVAELSEAGH